VCLLLFWAQTLCGLCVHSLDSNLDPEDLEGNVRTDLKEALKSGERDVSFGESDKYSIV